MLCLQIYYSWRSSIVNWWFFFCFGVLDLYFYLSTKTPFSRIKSDIGGKHLLTLIKNSLEFIKAVLEKSFMTSGNFYNWTWVLWSFNFEKYSYQISKTPPCPALDIDLKYFYFQKMQSCCFSWWNTSWDLYVLPESGGFSSNQWT